MNYSPETVDGLLNKFGQQGTHRSEVTLNFEAFIRLCAFLGQVRSTFQWTDTDRDGLISFDFNDFVAVAMNF